MDLDKLIEDEFPQDEGLCYLNHAAVAPWPKRTSDAVKSFAEEISQQGALDYTGWVQKETILRGQLQRLINAPSSNDIALLKNTSEAISVVACGLEWHAGDNIVSTNQEFPSNRIPWQAQEKFGVQFIAVNIDSMNDPEQALINACNAKTRVLTVSSVQYGTGLKLDLARLGQFCQGNDILFCVDAIQSLGAHHLDVQAINADFVMADGHKWMLGPEGIAVFYCREACRELLNLHQFGWHMVEDSSNYDALTWKIARNARRFECGSPNMLGIHALSASLTLFDDVSIETVERNILKNIKYIIDNIKDNNDITLVTPTEESRHAGIITFRIDGCDHAAIHHKLLENNVICAHRCGGIRFSPHFYTSQDTINKSLEILYATI